MRVRILILVLVLVMNGGQVSALASAHDLGKSCVTVRQARWEQGSAFAFLESTQGIIKKDAEFQKHHSKLQIPRHEITAANKKRTRADDRW